MKFFALYTKVKITSNSPWLDEYKQKYGEPYGYHITLKQPCFVEVDEVEVLKGRVAEYFYSHPISTIDAAFSKVKIDEPVDSEGGYVMLVSSDADRLIELQKGLVSYLNRYKDYVEEKTKSYQDNFIPHITIGYDLAPEIFKEAVKEIPENFNISATIDGVTLAIVGDKSEAERTNPDNLTEFYLKSGT